MFNNDSKRIADHFYNNHVEEGTEKIFIPEKAWNFAWSDRAIWISTCLWIILLYGTLFVWGCYAFDKLKLDKKIEIKDNLTSWKKILWWIYHIPNSLNTEKNLSN